MPYHQYVKHLDANRKVEKTGKSFLFVAYTMSRIIRHETTGDLAAFSDLFEKEYGRSMALPTDYTHAHFFPHR